MIRIAALIAVAALLAACAGGLLSKGDAPYLDANGDVVKAYAAERLAVVDAAIRTLPAIQAATVARTDNRLETVLTAQAPDGSSLRIRFVEEGRGLTVVRVRTGRIGYPNLEYSQQFHTFLAVKLNPDERPRLSASTDTTPPAPPIEEPTPETIGRPPQADRGAAVPPARRDAPPSPQPPAPEPAPAVSSQPIPKPDYEKATQALEADLMTAEPSARQEAPPRPEPPSPEPALEAPAQSMPEPATEKAAPAPEADLTAAVPPARQEIPPPPREPTPEPASEAPAQPMPEPATEKAAPAPEADLMAAVPPARQEIPPRSRPDYVVVFEKDSNIPSSDALEILNEAANRLQRNPDTFAELSGHADADEDPEAQYLVSESRALAVKSYLIGRGISAGRIRATWHGSDRPAPEPGDPVQQRRVEIRLIRGL